MIYNNFFDKKYCDKVIGFLKNECKIEKGFYSQIVGKKKILSATSSSIIYYTLNMLGKLNENEKKQAVEDILSFRETEDDFYKNAIGTDNDYTTWGTAQACLALIDLGCEKSRYMATLEWLCTVQKDDGGWSYDGRDDSQSHIIYCFYIVLALSRCKDVNQIQMVRALDQVKIYIEKFEPETMAEKTVKLFLIDYLGLREIGKLEKQKLLFDFRDMISRNDIEDVKTESSLHGQGHFYISFYFNAYYLLLRKFLNPDDLISLYLMNRIKYSIKQDRGWSSRETEKSKDIYSWATALSILSIKFWNQDCNKYDIQMDLIQNKLQNIKAEDLRISMFMQKCPLNGGQCNLLDKIKCEYKENNIFLDIPYRRKYVIFEDEIKCILKKAGLNAVIAKQEQRTKIILCKVCSMIQTCKYGIADISYETLNVPFELGLLYGLGKECAILRNTDADQPTDIEGIECIKYKNTAELGKGLSEWINDNIK